LVSGHSQKGNKMSRKIKVLGLGVAALALVALTASSSASPTTAQFHSHAEHTTVTAKQHVRNTFNVNAGTVHCDAVTLDGTSTQTTTKEWTVAPTYKNCAITTGVETLEADVDVNGCHYLLTANGEMHIQCPAKPIHITMPLCTIIIHPQTLTHLIYTPVHTGDTTTTSVTIDAQITVLRYTQSSLCPGGGGEFNNGTYSGAVETTCTNTDGNHVGCWWTTS
jgi:hypothetical protein